MAKVIDFDISKRGYTDLAKAAFAEGNTGKSIIYLKKALSLEPGATDVMLAMAEVFSRSGIYDISNATLFDVLNSNYDKSFSEQIFSMLAANFIEMGKPDVAEYYLRDYADDFDFQFADEDDELEKKLRYRIVYPRDEHYDNVLIAQAYQLGKEGKFDEAIKVLDRVEPDSEHKAEADHCVLLCLMMKNDTDAVIANAKRMLEKHDSLTIKCTLATAYYMEEKTEEANAVLKEILDKDYKELEQILVILPLLVNMEVHDQVAKYARRVLDLTDDTQIHILFWYSEALYNMGMKSEARKIMRRLNDVYGDYCAADFYLELYDREPETVHYGVAAPVRMRMERYDKVADIARMSSQEMDALSEDELKSACDMLAWAISDGNENISALAAMRLRMMQNEIAENIIRKKLVMPHLNFDLMCQLIWALMPLDRLGCVFNVVAQDRFKEVHFKLPKAIFVLPDVFGRAVRYSLCDIVFTDEEPNEYIDRLIEIVDGIAGVDENGNLKYTDSRFNKIGRFRCERTLAGVLLSKVYDEDDEDPRTDTILRYDLKPRTFDKYYNVIFGDDNED